MGGTHLCPWGSDCRQLKRQILTEAQGTACYNVQSRSGKLLSFVSRPLEAPRSAGAGAGGNDGRSGS